MASSRDRNGGSGSRFSRYALRPSETGGTRLAKWPPPYRARESMPIITKHPRGEVPKRAKPRGWRLIRAMFSEFADE